VVKMSVHGRRGQRLLSRVYAQTLAILLRFAEFSTRMSHTRSSGVRCARAFEGSRFRTTCCRPAAAMAARRSLLCYRLTKSAPWHVFVLRPQSVTISPRHPAVN
jgi:hypothetical protein